MSYAVCIQKEEDAYGCHEEPGYLLRAFKPYGGNATTGFVSESSLSDETFL